MSAIVRLCLCASALAVAVVGLEFAQPGWFRHLEPELPRLPESPRGKSTEDQLPEQLKLRGQMSQARVQLKHHIVEDVCLGRLTLVEAAARFRDLDRILPADYPDQFRFKYPCDSDEECYCLQVIIATESQLRAVGRPLAPVATRMRTELQEKLASGNLHLPDG